MRQMADGDMDAPAPDHLDDSELIDMARAVEAFRRSGLVTYPAPVRPLRLPDGRAGDWMPRPDNLATSWYALREWLGRLVYALRDGG